MVKISLLQMERIYNHGALSSELSVKFTLTKCHCIAKILYSNADRISPILCSSCNFEFNKDFDFTLVDNYKDVSSSMIAYYLYTLIEVLHNKLTLPRDCQ